MNYSIFRFTLDFHKHQSQVSIPVFLGDTAVRLYIGLTDGGNSYTIEDGCRAVIYGRKPGINNAESDIWIHDCVIENNSKIRYDFTDQTANVAGTTMCEVRLYGADGKLVTAPRFIIVADERVVLDEEVPVSESDLQAIDKIFASAVQIEASVSTAQTSATKAAKSATLANSSALRSEDAERGAEEQAGYAENNAIAAKLWHDKTQEIAEHIKVNSAIHGTFTLSPTDCIGGILYNFALDGLSDNGVLIVEPRANMQEIEDIYNLIVAMEWLDEASSTIGIVVNGELTRDITFEYTFIPTATEGKRLFCTALAGRASATELATLKEQVESNSREDSQRSLALSRHSERLSELEKRTDNLESFNLFSTVVNGDDGTMIVPARSARYAIIDSLSCTVTSVKSYGANLLNGGNSNPPVSNGVTFEKRTDGGYDIKRTESSANTASSYVLNKAKMIGDGDYITISIYGSTIGTRLRAYTFNADGTQAEVITLDDNTRSATLRRLSEAGATITIVFNIPPGTDIDGEAYIMVVNGDKPVRYYPYTTEPIAEYTFPKSITSNPNFGYASGEYIDFEQSLLQKPDGDFPITFEAGSNLIEVQSAGRLELECDSGNEGTMEARITYQEGSYVFE